MEKANEKVADRHRNIMDTLMQQLEEEQRSMFGSERNSMSDLAATTSSTDSKDIPFDERSIAVPWAVTSNSFKTCKSSEDDQDETRDDQSQEDSIVKKFKELRDSVAKLDVTDSEEENSSEPSRIHSKAAKTTLQKSTGESLDWHRINQERFRHEHDEGRKHVAQADTICSTTEESVPESINEQDGCTLSDHGKIPQHFLSNNYVADRLRQCIPDIIEQQQLQLPEDELKLISLPSRTTKLTKSSAKDKRGPDLAPSLTYSISTNDSTDEAIYSVHFATISHKEQMRKECSAPISNLKNTSESKHQVLKHRNLELKNSFTSREDHHEHDEHRKGIVSNSNGNCNHTYQSPAQSSEGVHSIVAQLQTQNKKLQEEKAEMIEQHNDLKKSLKNLVALNENMKAELTRMDDEYEDLRDSYNKLVSRNHQLEGKVQLSQQPDERCENAESKFREMQQSLEQVVACNKSLKEENISLKMNQELMEVKCRDLEESNNQLKAHNLKSEDMIDSLKAMQTALEVNWKVARDEVKKQRMRQVWGKMQLKNSELDLYDFFEWTEKVRREDTLSSTDQVSTRNKQLVSKKSDKGLHHQLPSPPLDPWKNASSSRAQFLSPSRLPLPPLSPSSRNLRSWYDESDEEDNLIDCTSSDSSGSNISEYSSMGSASDDSLQSALRPEHLPSNVLENLLREPEEEADDLFTSFTKVVALLGSGEPQPSKRASVEQYNSQATSIVEVTSKDTCIRTKKIASKETLQSNNVTLFSNRSKEIPFVLSTVPGKESETKSAGIVAKQKSTIYPQENEDVQQQQQQQKRKQQQQQNVLGFRKNRDPADTFTLLEFETSQSDMEPEERQSPDLSLTIRKSAFILACSNPCGTTNIREDILSDDLTNQARDIRHNEEKGAKLQSSDDLSAANATLVEAQVITNEHREAGPFESKASSVRIINSPSATMKRKHGRDVDIASNVSCISQESVHLKVDKRIPVTTASRATFPYHRLNTT